MANFRTIGWFANACGDPNNSNIYSPIYNFNTGESEEDFPLNVVTNFYWGAETITVNAAITKSTNLDPPSPPTQTTNINITFNSGEIAFLSTLINATTQETEDVYSYRNRIKWNTASEILCGIGHTSFIYDRFVFNRPEYYLDDGGRLFLDIDRIPRYNQITNKLYQPINCLLDYGDEEIGITSSNNPIFNATGTRSEIGICQIFSPWGNAITPLFNWSLNNNFVSGSMTITFTEADPNIRYA
jgi:hypothetical protein